MLPSGRGSIDAVATPNETQQLGNVSELLSSAQRGITVDGLTSTRTTRLWAMWINGLRALNTSPTTLRGHTVFVQLSSTSASARSAAPR